MFKEKIGEAAVYEQLAEEAAELSQAALKVARILRGENPTPVLLDEARGHAIEEFTDVCVCANDLGLKADAFFYRAKTKRWLKRIEEAKREKEKKIVLDEDSIGASFESTLSALSDFVNMVNKGFYDPKG